MESEVDTIQRALIEGVEQLATVDLDALTDPELHGLVVGVQRAIDRLTVAAAPALERWHQRGVWAGDGSKSPAARLGRETGSATASASKALRRASALATMPATLTAAVAGTLSVDRVDLLARANTAPRRDLFARDETFLLRQLDGLRFAGAMKAVEYWKAHADAALDHDGDAAHDHEQAATLSVASTLDGVVAVNGALDPVGGAVFENEIDRLAVIIKAADDAAGRHRTPGQRRAAALVEMACRSAAQPKGSRAARPLVTVLIGECMLAHLCELANGTVITPAHLVPYLGDALIETVLFDGPSTVVSVSRKRSFTGALRRAIEVRDRHCKHPSGCDDPADDCDVDHIVPVSQGGPTSQFNGRLECPTHNRNADKHDHGAQPLPEREITRRDELMVTLRWRYRWAKEHPDPVTGWPTVRLRFDPDNPRRFLSAA